MRCLPRGWDRLAAVALLVTGLALILTLTPALAQSEEDELYAAAQRIADLYAVHEETAGSDGDTVLSGGALTKEFFHPVTAVAMQGATFSFDPIYGGGEPPIEDIGVFPDTETGIHDDAGFVVVRFLASGEPKELTYQVFRIAADETWWVVDIRGDGWTLKELLLKR